MTTLKFRCTFIEGVLGTCSNNQEIYREFIASKSPDATTIEDEVAAVGSDAVVEKTITVFPRDEEGRPFLYDYQVKGFFNDTCSALARVPDTKSAKLKAFKKIIDGCIFVFPRRIPIELSGEMGDLQRPLRGQTAQGERIALARSETIPEGSKMQIEISVPDQYEPVVLEWLDYGQLKGLGQWRNVSWGRFRYEIVE